MKSILYVGATLMIGASIYGFVDYKRTSHRKEFINMYEAKKLPGSAVTTTKTNEVAVKKEIVATEKPATKITTPAVIKVRGIEKKYKPAKKKKFNYKLFSRAPLEERYIGKELPKDSLLEKSGSRESPKVRKN